MNGKSMSQLSNAIKVPMIILVIFVHENLNLDYDGYWGMLWAAMANVAVPVFFLISGYYFFYGREFSKGEYLRKLKKRCQTLLLPYLLWNLLPMLNIVAGNVFSILFRGKSTEALQGYLSDLWNKGIWHIWWDMTAGTMPYDSPLWYVRDLMVMCVLSPLIYVFARRFGMIGGVILILPYVLGFDTGIVGLGMASITFFTLGACFAVKTSKMQTPSEVAHRFRWLFCVTSAMSLMLYLLFYENSWAHVFQMFYIASGVFAFYSLMGLMSDKVIEKITRLSSSVFFIYALHNTCVLALCGGLMNRLPLPHSLVIVILPFVTFGVCYGIYLMARKICPQALAVLCGGRI